MGFFENILRKISVALAAYYGVVDSGKYAGCRIALCNPPKEKASTVYSFSQLLFVKDNKEVGCLSIVNDIEEIEYLETIQFPKTGNDGYRCKFTFRGGDTCEVDLFPSKLWVFYQNTSVAMPEETRYFFDDKLTGEPRV